MKKFDKDSEKKEAKFFCESCGNEVKRNAKFCSKCGKIFASVRCPKCGKVGNTEQFKAGCPRCGYAVTPVFKGLTNPPEAVVAAKKFHFETSLPIWVYIVTTIVLLVLVFCLYSCL